MLTKDELKTPRIFRPYGTIVVSATTTSTAAVPMILDTGSTSENPNVKIVNSSTSSPIQYEFATGTTGTAGTKSAYLGAGKTIVEDRGANTHIGVVSVTGTCQVSVTTGFGIYSGD